jgi:tetratricopeptide (TPR) repeat protein
MKSKSSQHPTVLRQLDAEIPRLKAAGKILEASVLQAQKATVYATLHDWQAAAIAYDQAAQLAQQAGDKACEALNRYGQVTVLYHLPVQRDKLAPILNQAIALAEQIEYTTLAAKAYHLLGSLKFDAGEVLGAIAAQTQAIAQLKSQLESASDAQSPVTESLAIQIWRTRSTLYVLLGQVTHAAHDLDRALAISQRQGNEDLSLQIQLDQCLLQRLSDDRADPQALFARLQSQSAPSISGAIALHQAIADLEAGQWKTALSHVESARRNALASTDTARYTRYLVSCLLVAQIQDQLDDRPGVLETLLTCKKTLEGSLGKETGEMVTPFLNALQSRWGQADLTEALKIYQTRIQVKTKLNIHLTPR